MKRTGKKGAIRNRRQAASRPSRVARGKRPSRDARVMLLVATRKGAWLYEGDAARKEWRVDGPHVLGHIVNHLVLDPRDGRTMVMAAKTGHLGPTIFRSTDRGHTWSEAAQPPAFAKVPEGQQGRTVSHTFWLTPGHASEPAVWWAGTSPPGLFRSADGGATWDGVDGWNEHLMYPKWASTNDGTPDGPLMNQVVIDPRNAAHMYVATSSGGVFESLDKGASWRPLNKGVEANFLPDPYPEYGQDAHCIGLHPLKPDRLYQQNHCGIYRIDRPNDTWERIGRNMPAEIGDIGFSIVPHPHDPDTAWVFPMDGTTVWPRTSPGGRPAVYRTRDAGRTWERQDRGLPREQAWYTVKRQAFTCDAQERVGLYFGTTSGEIWMSTNEGAGWQQIAAHLPEIYSVVAATVE